MNKKTWTAAAVAGLLCATGSSPAEYTHTVMVEGYTATWCPPCADAAEGIYDIFNSGLYDFYYIALVADVGCQEAVARAQELEPSGYIPEYFFDGGYASHIGWEGQGPYISLLNECGAIDVADIDIQIFVDWEEDAEGHGQVRTFVYVTNNEVVTYSGHLHAYVAEIISRWDTENNVPYHYAMIGYAINEDVVIPPGGTYYRSSLWNGYDHGYTAPEISRRNSIVIASVFDRTTVYTDEAGAAKPKRVGDCNGDGVVNVSDFLLMLSQWGTPGPEGDVNHDLNVDVSDFLLILSNWG
jgi:hypothetical protein